MAGPRPGPGGKRIAPQVSGSDRLGGLDRVADLEGERGSLGRDLGILVTGGPGRHQIDRRPEPPALEEQVGDVLGPPPIPDVGELQLQFLDPQPPAGAVGAGRGRRQSQLRPDSGPSSREPTPVHGPGQQIPANVLPGRKAGRATDPRAASAPSRASSQFSKSRPPSARARWAMNFGAIAPADVGHLVSSFDGGQGQIGAANSEQRPRPIGLLVGLRCLTFERLGLFPQMGKPGLGGPHLALIEVDPGLVEAAVEALRSRPVAHQERIAFSEGSLGLVGKTEPAEFSTVEGQERSQLGQRVLLDRGEFRQRHPSLGFLGMLEVVGHRCREPEGIDQFLALELLEGGLDRASGCLRLTSRPIEPGKVEANPSLQFAAVELGLGQGMEGEFEKVQPLRVGELGGRSRWRPPPALARPPANRPAADQQPPDFGPVAALRPSSHRPGVPPCRRRRPGSGRSPSRSLSCNRRQIR